MTMKFLQKLIEDSGASINSTAVKLGVTPQQLHQWLGKGKSDNPRAMRFSSLIRIRKYYKLTWQQLGKMLEDEFEEDK